MAAPKKYLVPTIRTTVTLTTEIVEWMDEEGRAKRMSRSEMVQEALRQWKGRLDKSRGKDEVQSDDLPGQRRFVD